jgi:NAD(P)-dependent dehydrogenase (short-subunit alcohol dehydrogenase family)
MRTYGGSGKPRDKVAIITGATAGLAGAIAVAKGGADVAIVYLEEHKDAKETRRLIHHRFQKKRLRSLVQMFRSDGPVSRRKLRRALCFLPPTTHRI